MRVVPVIDLKNGHVVRGVAGRRSEYQPIQSQIAEDAWPATTARALVTKFGFDTVYVADLDAIMHGQRNTHGWEEIAKAGLKLWLDAGVGTVSDAMVVVRELRRFSVDPTIIVGLESLETVELLVELVHFLGPASLAFSLDLERGRPLTRIENSKGEQPIEIVRWMVKAGVQRLVVLDLADVGVAGGTQTLDLCRKIRREFPAIELVAGGGVRGIDDLKAIAEAGCDAALVASALHDGRLTREQIRQVENLPH